MDYKVFTRDIQLTEAIESYIEKRMQKPDRLLVKHEDLVSTADFKVSKEDGIFKVEITTHFKVFNKIIKVEERSGDLYEAIDDVTDALERKIRKLKAKLQDHEKDVQPNKTFKEDKNEEHEENFARIKRHDLSLMSSEEAKLQAEMLGHQFYVFRNSETDEVNVIYKRNNGTYGLIEFIG